MIEVTYDPRAYDLARYQPDPADDVIAAFVDWAAAGRPELTEQDSYTLLQFARRQAAHALRTKDARAAEAAVTALTLVDRDRIDWRDLSVDFPLFAASETGADVGQVIDRAIARSTPSTAAAFQAVRTRAGAMSLASCRLLPVHTQHGLGFIDITEAYDAGSGLAEKAVALVDAIDAEGTYRVRTLATSQLPMYWFKSAKRSGHVRNANCMSLHAERVGTPSWSHGLLIFLAQVRNARTATKLIGQLRDASSPRRPRVGLIEENRLLAIIGGSSRTDDESLETELSLARFTDLYGGSGSS